MPIACGMLLTRDDVDLSRAFHLDPAYTVEDKDRMRSGVDTYIRSRFFTRHGAALKLWWSLRAHGWDAYARRMVHDCDLDGGWGVDALLGRQTRRHRDLDLALRLADVEGALDVLAKLGYRVVDDELPTRVDLRADDDRGSTYIR